jgi:hypothetical protein
MKHQTPNTKHQTPTFNLQSGRRYMSITSGINLTLKICLLFILVILCSKPVMGYELKWGMFISNTHKQEGGGYSLVGGSAPIGGKSENATYTTTAYTPPTTFQYELNLQPLFISSVMIRLGWNKMADYYILSRSDVGTLTQTSNNVYEDKGLKPATTYIYTLSAYQQGSPSATDTLTTATLPAKGKFIPYHNLFHPLKGEKVDVYFEIDASSNVSIKIYDLTGELVKELIDTTYPAGKYWTHWDGKDDSGKLCSAGVYIISIKSEGFKDEKKIILVK